MDFFQGVDWGAYAALRHLAGKMPGVASAFYALHWVGLVGWIPLMALAPFASTRRDVRHRANVMLAVAVAAMTCLFLVRWAADSTVPPDSENRLGLGLRKTFPSIPAFAFPLASILALTVWFHSHPNLSSRKRALIVAMFILLTNAIAFGELLLGLAFVSHVITGLAGGLGFGLLARSIGSWAGFNALSGATMTTSTAIQPAATPLPKTDF